MKNVAAQQAIMELQLRDMIDVVIQVPEDVIALVKKEVNYQPNVVFDSYPESQLPGKHQRMGHSS